MGFQEQLYLRATFYKFVHIEVPSFFNALCQELFPAHFLMQQFSYFFKTDIPFFFHGHFSQRSKYFTP